MRWLTLIVISSFVLTGCSDGGRSVQNKGVDREQLLIGHWQGKDLVTDEDIAIIEGSGPVKLDPDEVARLMAAAAHFELKRDKTFAAEFGVLTTSGEFTFNGDTGEVVLKILQVKMVPEADASNPDLSWTAYLNDDNNQLLFFPVPPADAAILRQGKLPTGKQPGIKLEKRM